MTFKSLLATDLTASFTTDEWAEDIVYTPAVGDAVTIPAIWDESYEEVDPDTGAAIQSGQPRATVRSDDLSGIVPGPDDRITRNSETFRVVEVQPNGQGVTGIYLHGI